MSGKRPSTFALLLVILMAAVLAVIPAAHAQTLEATLDLRTSPLPPLSELLAAGDIRPHLRRVVTPAGTRRIRLRLPGARSIVLDLPRDAEADIRLWHVLVFAGTPSAGRTDTQKERPGDAGSPSEAFTRIVLKLTGGRLSGSGLHPLLPYPQVRHVVTDEAIEAVREGDRWQLLVPAGKEVHAIAMASTSPLATPLMLQEATASRRQERIGLLMAGLLLGTVLVLTVNLLIIGSADTPVRLLWLGPFVVGVALFVVLHGHDAPLLPLGLRLAPGLLERLEALAEALLLAGLMLRLLTLLLAHRSKPGRWHRWALPALLPLLAIPFLQPLIATPVVRAGLALMAVILPLVHWRMLRRQNRDGRHQSRMRLLGDGLFLLWMLAFAATLGGHLPAQAAERGLVAGLVLMLLVHTLQAWQDSLSPSARLRRWLDDAARQALALRGAGLVAWDMDAETGALHLSSELAATLGLPAEMFEGDAAGTFRQLLHPLDRDVFAAAMHSVMQGGGRIDIQIRLTHADGSYRWYRMLGRPVRARPDEGAVLRLMGVLIDITAHRRAEDRLLSDTVRDRLTGLPNRALLMDRLARALQRQEEGRRQGLHLFLLDIDRFRSINEAWGHDTGDMLLKEVARRLQRQLNEGDTLARLPGDQFAIISDPGKAGTDPIAFGHRLQRALATPYRIDRQDIRITACIGILPLDGNIRTPEEALRLAEIALYAAREKGPGQVALFDADMQGERVRLATLEQDLRQAIEKGALDLVYQPIVRIDDGRLVGFEALVRWEHPHHGLLPADVFLPLVEELGMEAEVAEVVLERAIRDLGIWQRAFRTAGEIFVAVNLASPQLTDPGLTDRLREMLEREHIDPATLRLELTEARILDSPERGRRVIQALAELGVRVACDDFGTGYSSLSIIRDLPFSTLKLDRSLIAGGHDELRAAIVLRSIIDMAHALDMEVVAEGVETEEQLLLARDLGCDYAQGWHVARPMTARQVTDLLTRLALEISDGEQRLSRFAEILSRLEAGVRQHHG